MLATRPMTWQDVLNDPSLQDLPYKIELDEHGQIIMSPASKPHARYSSKITRILETQLQNGEGITEAPVETSRGVRVPDASWASTSRANQPGDLFTTAPEICVEVISPSNTVEEIQAKLGLYLKAGALEVWTCSLQGEMRFYDVNGKLEQSRFAPNFPAQITLG